MERFTHIAEFDLEKLVLITCRRQIMTIGDERRSPKIMSQVNLLSHTMASVNRRS